MTSDRVRYSFGPVPSRRLGKSLGINNIPAKVCTYSCIYCQVGRTSRMQIEREPFYEPAAIFEDVQNRLAEAARRSERVDYLTFVPDGEPTLDVNLGKVIGLLKPLGVPVGVITNSSLLWREDVRAELRLADWVSVKVDAVQEPIWRQINRPHKALSLNSVRDGIVAFAGSFTGTFVTETMLVQGLQDDEKSMVKVAEFIHRLQPKVAYLSIPTRPPVERLVRGPDEETLNRVYQAFARRIERVEYLIGYEGNDFAFTGDVEKDLLSITAVHPMREEAVRALLARTGSSWEVVERLLAKQELAQTKHDGHLFYLRNLTIGREQRRDKVVEG